MARITLERDGQTAPYSTTCGIYGWMVHTRFFSDEEDTTGQMATMKDALTNIIDRIPIADTAADLEMKTVSEEISAFVDCFP
jgi:hypothetical protein